MLTSSENMAVRRRKREREDKRGGEEGSKVEKEEHALFNLRKYSFVFGEGGGEGNNPGYKNIIKCVVYYYWILQMFMLI